MEFGKGPKCPSTQRKEICVRRRETRKESNSEYVQNV
jgi:hypothetical protein